MEETTGFHRKSGKSEWGHFGRDNGVSHEVWRGDRRSQEDF